MNNKQLIALMAASIYAARVTEESTKEEMERMMGESIREAAVLNGKVAGLLLDE